MDSPASKAFADKLARYAYDPTNGSPARKQSSGPNQPIAGPSTPTRRIPRTPRTSVKRKRATSRGSASSDDEHPQMDQDEVYDPSPSRKRSSASTTPGKSTPKSGKKPRPFAGPEVYAHLKPVTDYLKPDLDIVFCGINPGKMSSTLGHHFAHPTNKFWKSLHQSGITDRFVSPSEDYLIPELYNLGLTNLCDRPTSEQSELSTLEMRLNVYNLTSKILTHRPKVVCFVGKKIWDVFESVVLKTAGPAVRVQDAESSSPSAQNGMKVERAGLDDLARGPVGDDGLVVKQEREEFGDRYIPESTPVKILSTTASGEVIIKTETDIKAELGISCDLDTTAVPSTSSNIDSKPLPISAATPPRPSNRIHPGAKTPKVKASLDWTLPRIARLPHAIGYTYFWVTPNTSGLERTPLAEQVRIFGHLRAFVEGVKSGRVVGTFRDIDFDGVRRTVESMREAAVAKGHLV